ncbi:hypothetical protein Bphy_5890 (plasmid) [Paraburkholderia phymatum STM815]|uniref:Uncharacterized protein n=1 Tax=Paraburkholderia phymatum (strain DSM 17167 / CIP 108236 / LMG 21445 / STM815) TaxID=391038 RepID=B2JVH7_PARP8|nr:hypothetical protein Bphy_5890 [Paraburkholderia phymatum STM815]
MRCGLGSQANLMPQQGLKLLQSVMSDGARTRRPCRDAYQRLGYAGFQQRCAHRSWRPSNALASRGVGMFVPVAAFGDWFGIANRRRADFGRHMSVRLPGAT